MENYKTVKRWELETIIEDVYDSKYENLAIVKDEEEKERVLFHYWQDCGEYDDFNEYFYVKYVDLPITYEKKSHLNNVSFTIWTETWNGWEKYVRIELDGGYFSALENVGDINTKDLAMEEIMELISGGDLPKNILKRNGFDELLKEMVLEIEIMLEYVGG